MFNPKQLDEMTDRFIKLLPSGISGVKSDLEKKFRAILQSTFSKLDLVSREEFEVQSAVLVKTRAKLETLEKQLAELETTLAKK